MSQIATSRRGVPGENLLCPIALAASEQMGREMRVRSDLIEYASGDFCAFLPEEAAAFVRAFDDETDSDAVHPFSFEVDLL